MLAVSVRDRVAGEAREVDVDFLEVLELDGPQPLEDTTDDFLAPDGQLGFDLVVVNVDVTVLVVDVAGFLVLDVQLRGLVGVEAQATRL